MINFTFRRYLYTFLNKGHKNSVKIIETKIVTLKLKISRLKLKIHTNVKRIL
jgi:hypothetical protein